MKLQHDSELGLNSETAAARTSTPGGDSFLLRGWALRGRMYILHVLWPGRRVEAGVTEQRRGRREQGKGRKEEEGGREGGREGGIASTWPG